MSMNSPTEASNPARSLYSATYSPDDNKLRLYSVGRLPGDIYQRVHDAGFSFAPKQELFVAPMWTPSREDLLIELCGEVGDEDKSLTERAEERAERFEEYGENRADDAERARAAVAAIADHIPLGQPILVGHHSEKHARRDAKRIETGMRRAVQMWETSQYWVSRAKGAIRHAKYKELPGVRHRRIKTIEAAKRKQERTRGQAAKLLETYLDPKAAAAKLRDGRELLPALLGTYEGGLSFDHQSQFERGELTFTDALARAVRNLTLTVTHCDRWIAHYDNRLAYERAMLAEDGGLAADQFTIETGGRALIDGEWLVVLRVNRVGGAVTSLTTTPSRHVHWTKKWKNNIERVKDYRAPTAEETAKVRAATKLAPLCNYPGEGFREMTQATWTSYQRHGNASTETRAATEKHGAHRVRRSFSGDGRFRLVQVYIADAKRIDPPAPPTAPSEPVTFAREVEPICERPVYKQPESTTFDDLKDTLAVGVQVVSAPQLFPTPSELAARMVREADIRTGHEVLEPSAGTGAILHAIRAAVGVDSSVRVTAVEIQGHFVHLANIAQRVHFGDFLKCNGELGKFDRIVMNPPFADGQDVEHVEHALTMLKPGGRLVAIMSAGVTFRRDRRTAAFRQQVADSGGTIEALPEGSFKEAGTSVRAVIVVLDAPAPVS
jgi:phospholipid N-methyltransferase